MDETNAYSNYALRSLQLAALRSPDLIRVDDVVRAHGLARPHVVKIVHDLGRAGFVITRRGRGGGGSGWRARPQRSWWGV